MPRRSASEVAGSRAQTLAAAVQLASVVGLEGLTIGRLADAFGFLLPGPKAFEAGAKYLLARGYR